MIVVTFCFFGGLISPYFLTTLFSQIIATSHFDLPCHPLSKESGRTVRRHSSFYIGLYGSNWVDFMENSYELVAELMTLTPNKPKYYQQGERAMRATPKSICTDTYNLLRNSFYSD